MSSVTTCRGEHADTVSSDSSHGNLERFAKALTIQRYTMSFTETGNELTLSVNSIDGSQTALVPELEPGTDETDRQYYVAEIQ